MNEKHKYGTLICREDYDLPEDLMSEWNQWLDDNFDPGNWDADKDRRHHPPKRYVDTHCPPHLCERVLACPLKPETHCGGENCPVCKHLARQITSGQLDKEKDSA